MRGLLFFVVSVCLYVMAPFQAYAEEEVIRLSTMVYPPYSYEEDGKVTGMAIDIVAEALESQGYKMSADLMPWSRVLTSAKRGKIDGVIMIFKNEERLAHYIYSQEVLLPEIISFFKHVDSPVTFDGSFESVGHLRITPVDSVSYGKKFDNAVKEGALPHLRGISSLEEALTMLEAKRTDLVPGNRDVTYQTLARMPNLKNLVEVTPEIESLPSYVSFTKKRDLTAVRDAFDAGIRQMRESGRYDEIIRSYTPAAQK